MKSNKTLKLCILLMLCVAMLLLIGCGDQPDGPSDDPGTDPSDEPSADDGKLYLTKDGEVNFTFVYSRSDKNVKKAAENLETLFAAKGLTFKWALANDSKAVTDCEILVGSDIKYRDDFIYDEHQVGIEGYAITVNGDKVVINGGSPEAINEALTLFLEEYLGIKDDFTPDLNNLAIDRSLNVIKKQTYRISSVTVDGKPLSEFDLVADSNDDEAKASALALQDYFYKYAGVWLDIFDDSKAEEVENAVYVRSVEDAGKDGFKVYVSDGSLYVDCAYYNKFIEATESFGSAKILRASGDISFDKDFEYTKTVSVVTYEEFGVVGDGVADDYQAILDAHNFANNGGQKVIAGAGRYNLGQHTSAIIIMTDVDFTGATFIIDDSEVGPQTSVSNSNVFTVKSKQREQSINTIATLKAGQTNIGVTFDGPMLVYIRDGVHKMYIRYGLNENSGSNQQEVILVDKDGNVDPSTPILWDYDNLDRVIAYPANDPALNIKGGTFITIANQAPSLYTYYKRGISINRSNVTVTGLTFLIQGELDHGAPYGGSISIGYANNVTIQDSVVTGHKKYQLSTDTRNSMGTYALSASNSNAVTWKNVTQSNSITDSKYWGAMASNFCKNLKYDGCKLSRFDAHQGMYNTTIINSELGHQKINAIGTGLLHIENCRIHGNNAVNLRSDYGSTWEGDLVLKNIHLVNTGTVTLVSGSYTNHYFGYKCHLPHNITVDGLTLEISTTVYVLPSFASSSYKIDLDTLDGKENGTVNNNPTYITDSVTVRNANYTVRLSSNTNLFANTVFVHEK